MANLGFSRGWLSAHATGATQAHQQMDATGQNSGLSIPDVSEDLSWWINIVLLMGIILAQLRYVVVRKFCKRDAPLPYAQSARVASQHEPTMQLDIEANALAAADSCAPISSPPHPTSSVVVVGVANTETPPARKRMAFVDNLKVFLTCTVVFHHILCEFGNGMFFLYNIVVVSDKTGEDITSTSAFKWAFCDYILTMNQSYFMALFFFISGYFAPSSLDKKGCGMFIQDKVKRLGLPAVWWYLLGGPLLTYFIFVGIGAGTSIAGFTYGQNGLWMVPGPPWFILCLFAFSIFYALGHGKPLRMKLPSITMLLGVGLGLGILRSIVPATPFVITVPGNLSWLIFYIPAFWIGSVAKRNQWLDELLALPVEKVWFLRILTLVLLVVQWWSNYLDSQGSSYLGNYDAAKAALQGMFCISVSLVELDLFHRYFNKGGILASRFADAAYTVYLIHPWVVVPISWTFTLIVRQLNSNPPSTIWDSKFFRVVDTIPCSGEWMIWLGVAYTSVLSLLILWPLSWLIKQLPVLRDVL